MINACGNCETPEEEIKCDLNLDELSEYTHEQIMDLVNDDFDEDELYIHSYVHIAHLVREQEFKNNGGVVLH